MTIPTISLTPRRAAMLAGFDSSFEVLVRVAAPDVPPSAAGARTPLHLALVIDRSGSMNGQPLDEAKRAAEFVISSLAAGDRASLIAFDHAIETRMSLQDMSERAAFLRAIGGIGARGNTNLHGGWFGGAETLAPSANRETISRIILLSDGGANAGLTDPDAINRQCAELASTGVTTSTYGLGRNFNEDLMIGMARAGLGNNYYGETAEDLMDPFREEFALLNALCARGLELQLVPAAGVKAEVLNQYPNTDAGHWRLPDLAYGGEAWALVRLTVAARPEGAATTDLLTATVRYSDMAGEPRGLAPCGLTLPVVPATAYAAIAEDPLVLRRASEIEAAQLQLQARHAARHGDWDQVDVLLAKANELATHNPWLKDVVQELQHLATRRDEMLFSKEAAYSASRFSTRLSSSAEGPVPGDEIALYLRRKAAQGKRQPDSPDKKWARRDLSGDRCNPVPRQIDPSE
jgi:Ca-activated chloride channel family protein